MTTRSAAMAAGYIHAMMEQFPPASPAGRKLGQWLQYNGRAVGIDFEAALNPRARRGRRRRAPSSQSHLSMRSWAKLKGALKAVAATSDDAVAANVDALAHAIGLDAVAADIFRFVFHCDRDSGFSGLCSGIVSTRSVDSLGLIAAALNQDATVLWGHLARGPLAQLFLIDITGDSHERFTYAIPYRLAQALLPPSDGLADVERRLIGAPVHPRLDAGDFEHVARERDFVIRMLRGALAARSAGVNILIHGEPGTGKSEFCKVVAAALGCDLFAVGEADENGQEPTRAERVDALQLAQRLAGRRTSSLLLFDEMEDVLAQGERAAAHGRRIRRAGSKVFFNRLLEQNPVPVLWTANAVSEFDPAFLRRMTFAFEMKKLPQRGRAKLWSGLAQRRGLDLPEPQAVALARNHNVAPSLVSGALQAVAIAGGAADDLDFVVNSLAGTCGVARQDAAGAPARFSPVLVNADCDLVEIEQALRRAGAPRDVSMCLYGPPGTGKSAFARHLADAMGLDPLVKRGSDLLSKWVGGTEQRIAEAFAEARADERFLIIDEAEGFLWSRAGAGRSWEVSMVNELLVAMEQHTLPFVCTTNLVDLVDPAALRRFSFKVKFDFMTPAQSVDAYRQFFGRPAPAALRDLVALTPGDFAAVARRLRVIGHSDDDAVVLRLLEQEVAIKALPTVRMGY